MSSKCISPLGWVKVDNTHGAGHFPIEQIRIKKNNGVQGQMEQTWLADNSYKIPQLTDFIHCLPFSKPIILELHSLVSPKIKSISLDSCVSCCFNRQRGCKTRENISDTENITDCLQTLHC